MHSVKRLLFLLLLPVSVMAQQAVPMCKRLYEYLPGGDGQTAVIVCPGGSYCWLSKKYEGSEVARWLVSHGMAAYVLHYPTAGWAGYAWHTRLLFRGSQYPDQLRALACAMQAVRSKGYERVGVMGFSAGGHLALCGAAYLPKSLQPDFVAALYPVVSLSAPCTHRRSRRGLLGERRWRNKIICDSLSMELHADRISCPVFLMNCKDDPIVDHRNAELMDSALTAHRKPHLYLQYATGGHGFGTTAAKTSREAIGWKNRFLEWLKHLFRN